MVLIHGFKHPEFFKIVMQELRFSMKYLLLFILLSTGLILQADVYDSSKDRSEENAAKFLNIGKAVGRYLMFRDFSKLLDQNVTGTEALAYGTGAGNDIAILQREGFHVSGVDISKEMIAAAKQCYPEAPLFVVQNGDTPFNSGSFDLVFSSMVLLEMGTEEEILTYLKEAHRVLKDGGSLIVLSASENLYSKNWLVNKIDFPENKHLTSGCRVRLYAEDVDIEFQDYFWFEDDYRRFLSESGFQIETVYHPLGLPTDPHPWKDELHCSPYVFFVAKKTPQ